MVGGRENEIKPPFTSVPTTRCLPEGSQRDPRTPPQDIAQAGPALAGRYRFGRRRKRLERTLRPDMPGDREVRVARYELFSIRANPPDWSAGAQVNMCFGSPSCISRPWLVLGR